MWNRRSRPWTIGRACCCRGCNITKRIVTYYTLMTQRSLSAKKREELYEVIMEKAVCAKTAVVSPKVIDEINILQATYEAMRQAISMLEPQPTLLLNDAVNIPGEPMKQVSIIKAMQKVSQ